MWTQKLTPAQRLNWLLSLFGALACIIPGALALASPTDPWLRTFWLIFFPVNIAAAILALTVLIRGHVNLKWLVFLGKAFSGFAFALAAFLAFRAIAEPSPQSIAWAIFGVLSFLLAMAINLWNRIIQSETTTREHFLRLELRLTSQSPPPSP
jgi:hypothetical protein